VSRRRLSQCRTTSLTSMVGAAATEQPSNFKIVLTKFDMLFPCQQNALPRAVRRKTFVKLVFSRETGYRPCRISVDCVRPDKTLAAMLWAIWS
jgi:hypothetical protein